MAQLAYYWCVIIAITAFVTASNAPCLRRRTSSGGMRQKCKSCIQRRCHWQTNWSMHYRREMWPCKNAIVWYRKGIPLRCRCSKSTNVQKGKGLLYYHAAYGSAYILEFICSHSKLEATSIHICEIVASGPKYACKGTCICVNTRDHVIVHHANV